jgi:ABC-type nickel/cobalt efflux system permease component RcnA
MTGTHSIYYKNNFAPKGSAYQVNAFVDRGVAITLGKQNRDSIQQSMTVDYVIGQGSRSEAAGSAAPATTVPAAVAATAATSTTAATTGTASLNTPPGTAAVASGQVRQVLAYLYEPALSPWVLLLALGLAGALGGLHALTPGHGKTLVAAYLVGSRGTVRHAVALGSIVTFTHTSSVIVIGLLALFAGQFVVPNVLVPVLEILSGLLVVFMGARLVRQRWTAFRSRRNPDHGHTHDRGHIHDHSHGHSHDHAGDHTYAYAHDHGDGHTHSHVPPAEGIKPGSLVAMGVSGGLVPCPEALGIMVIAIGLNRILLGLGLIVSFSFGLAAVLIVIGILLVRSRSLVARFGGAGSRWSSALPLCSAVIVTVLGAGIALSGLATYLGRG